MWLELPKRIEVISFIIIYIILAEILTEIIEEGFLTLTGTHQQGAMEMLWRHMLGSSPIIHLTVSHWMVQTTVEEK